MNNIQNFIRLVYRLRKAQKLYAKTGTQSAQMSVNDLEESVDRQLGTMGLEGSQIKQMRLDAAVKLKTDEEPGQYKTE